MVAGARGRVERGVIGQEEADQQAAALLGAAEASPVRQFRYELRRRGQEWKRAALDLAMVEDDGAIELAGSVLPGMRVLLGSEEGDWAPVVRQLERAGQFSLHLQDSNGRDRYLNFHGASSPVVVRA